MCDSSQSESQLNLYLVSLVFGTDAIKLAVNKQFKKNHDNNQNQIKLKKIFLDLFIFLLYHPALT